MYNDRASSSYHRSSPSGVISDWRNIKFSNVHSPSNHNSSTERLNSSTSLNRGKDGIFRPKSIFSLATEIDFESSSRLLSRNMMTPIQTNPRLAHLNPHYKHHRETSLTRNPDTMRYSSSTTTNSGRSTPTRNIDFYSNFNDNLSYLNSNGSGGGSRSGSSSNYSNNLCSPSPSSYGKTSSYASSSYRFTTAYHAPKYRERPLLSNLNLKFSAAKPTQNGNATSHLVRNGIGGERRGSGTSSPHKGSSTSTTSSATSSHNNSVSSNEAISTSNKQQPALERNKFLIKFREHDKPPLNNKGELERRRSSISWDIPYDHIISYNQSQHGGNNHHQIHEPIKEVELENEPENYLGNNYCHEETSSSSSSDIILNNNVESTNKENKNHCLIRWKGSFNLNDETNDKIAGSDEPILFLDNNKKHDENSEDNLNDKRNKNEPMLLKENLVTTKGDIYHQNEETNQCLTQLRTSDLVVEGRGGSSVIISSKTTPKPVNKDKDQKTMKGNMDNKSNKNKEPDAFKITATTNQKNSKGLIKTKSLKLPHKIVNYLTVIDIPYCDQMVELKLLDRPITVTTSPQIELPKEKIKKKNKKIGIENVSKSTTKIDNIESLEKISSHHLIVNSNSNTDGTRQHKKPIKKSATSQLPLPPSTSSILPIPIVLNSKSREIESNQNSQDPSLPSSISKSTEIDLSMASLKRTKSKNITKRKSKEKSTEQTKSKNEVISSPTKQGVFLLPNKDTNLKTSTTKELLEKEEPFIAELAKSLKPKKCPPLKIDVDITIGKSDNDITPKSPIVSSKSPEIKILKSPKDYLEEASVIKSPKLESLRLSPTENKSKLDTISSPKSSLKSQKNTQQQQEVPGQSPKKTKFSFNKVLTHNKQPSIEKKDAKSAITSPISVSNSPKSPASAKDQEESKIIKIEKSKKSSISIEIAPRPDKNNNNKEIQLGNVIESIKLPNSYSNLQQQQQQQIPVPTTASQIHLSTTEELKNENNKIIQLDTTIVVSTNGEPVKILNNKKKKTKDSQKERHESISEEITRKKIKSSKTTQETETRNQTTIDPQSPKLSITTDTETLKAKLENESSSLLSSSPSSIQTSRSNSEKGQQQLESPSLDNSSQKVIKISQQDPFQRRHPHQKKIRFREYGIDDFQFLTVLGRGSFGKVLLAELINHDCHFAVKCLKKQTVIEDDDVESIMIERKVLAYGTSHPFICKLFCTFQTESHLFFAMELCSGGDLMFHVQKEGKFPEIKSRFYASEILCAIWFLHKRGIIYRDLKLDNVMVANDGHIRLVDFGMCVGKVYREEFLPSNFCGTPEYMAPEIIKGVKYNHSVDYWALGVVIYEMCVGTSPFHGTDEDELLWNVCNTEVHYPKFLTEQVKNLIVLLLKKNPQERLGLPNSPHGEIVQQPWFHGVQWDMVDKCKVKPPFIPQLAHDADVSYFDQYFTKETPCITPCDKPVNENDQLLFQGFNYTNHRMTD